MQSSIKIAKMGRAGTVIGTNPHSPSRIFANGVIAQVMAQVATSRIGLKAGRIVLMGLQYWKLDTLLDHLSAYILKSYKHRDA